jgi:hypothetical protein
MSSRTTVKSSPRPRNTKTHHAILPESVLLCVNLNYKFQIVHPDPGDPRKVVIIFVVISQRPVVQMICYGLLLLLLLLQ